MKNKKKNMSMLFSFAFLFAMIGLVAVSGTYAKYQTALTGTDTATVAKWAWEINNENLNTYQGTGVSGATEVFNLDLFSTIKEADGTTAEANVADDKIAPGTGGTISFTVKNNSDVDGVVTLTLSETNTSGVPIEYSFDGTTWKKSTDFDDGKFVSSKINAAKNSADASTINVYWRWSFGSTTAEDEADTAIGFAAAEGAVQVTVTSTLTFTQVD